MSGPDLDLEQRLVALRELIRALFDAEQLRRFLLVLPGGDRLTDELPGASASFAALYHETTILLNRWRLVDTALFNAMVRARPTARPEIERVAGLWLLAITTNAPERGAPSLVDADAEAVRATNDLRELRVRLSVARSRGLPITSLERTLREKTRALHAGPTLRAGDVLADGRYLLVERLGEGAFAVVWRAWDEEKGRELAIKVLHGELARQPTRVERFERGAKLMASLQHPNIARIYEPSRLEGGHRYVVMALLPGGDLHAAVLAGRFDLDRALLAVLDVGAALQFAHEHGVVHRDVKPHNILLDEGGGAKLTDFDLGRVEDGTRNTRTSASMGTLLYAAPEALSDARDVGPEGDVASLAMTAAFCVYGADLPPESLYQRDRFFAGLGCTEALRAVLVRGAAHRPQDRYASAAEFCAALRGAMAGETSELVAPVIAVTSAAAPASKGRLRLLVAGLAGAGLLFVGGIAGIAGLLQGYRSPAVDAKEAEPEVAVAAGVETPTAGSSSTTAPQGARAYRAQRWVTIPAGEGVIGDNGSGYDDEKPRWRVKFTQPFAMQETEVTNAQYAEVVATWTYGTDNSDHPVTNVNWSQASAYCGAVGGRLPTEVEWEYAARAGTETVYFFGDSPDKLGDYAWYDSNAGGETHPVAQKKPNPWGLYDMSGNVWEWAEDVYSGDSWQQMVDKGTSPVVDPSPFVDSGDNSPRVNRGGSAWSTPGYLRSSDRSRLNPQYQDQDLGFRCVRGPSRQP